jgi:hypothetical protein
MQAEYRGAQAWRGAARGIGWHADQMRAWRRYIDSMGQVASTEQPSVGLLGNFNRLIEFL